MNTYHYNFRMPCDDLGSPESLPRYITADKQYLKPHYEPFIHEFIVKFRLRGPKWLSEQSIEDFCYSIGIKEGYLQGLEDGIQDGYYDSDEYCLPDGYITGYDTGYMKGYKQGYKQAIEHAQEAPYDPEYDEYDDDSRRRRDDD